MQRLIDVETYVIQRGFHSRFTDSKYAILSHRWFEEGEIAFDEYNPDDLRDAEKTQRNLSKIRSACAKAREEGIKWLWIDSCCIDKSSSSELSEAINSMFAW